MTPHISTHIDPAQFRASIPADADRLLLVTDSNVRPLLGELLPTEISGHLSVIEPGESHKTLRTAERLWGEWMVAGATRRSVVINIGGGMVSDLGGFAAALFKRGLCTINVSTTLLGDVDAACGGKTAVNFAGVKNQIGVFAEPHAVFIPTDALSTLPLAHMLSGFGEMAKTALLDSESLTRRVYDVRLEDTDSLAPMIADCVAFKQHVVELDPHEHGLRRILNLGHTAGHAFESFSLQNGAPLPHGVAVAHGILVALVLSHARLRMDSGYIYDFRDKVLALMPPLRITCDQYPQLLHLMHADKKNIGDGKVSFVLLRKPGEPMAGCDVEDEEVKNALDIYRDLTSQ